MRINNNRGINSGQGMAQACSNGLEECRGRDNTDWPKFVSENPVQSKATHKLYNFKFDRMFQYPSSYISPSMTYAFMPSMGYQLCYLPQEQLLILPQNCFDSSCYSTPQAHSEPEDKLGFKTFALESPKVEKKVDLGQGPALSGGVCAEMISERPDQRVRGQAKQKFGRNISSNIFHLMVKFIKKQKKMKAVVTRIIQQNKMSVRPSQFYQIFKNRSYKLKAYANSAKIAEFWRGPACEAGTSRGQKEDECSRIFRILGKHYLNYHHLPYVYNSLKIKTESKKLHMDSIRKILAL